MDFESHESDDVEIPAAAEIERDVDVEPEPEPVEFLFDHDEDDAVLSLAVRGGNEILLEAGESYSTADRHEIRALDAHPHVDRVNA